MTENPKIQRSITYFSCGLLTPDLGNDFQWICLDFIDFLDFAPTHDVTSSKIHKNFARYKKIDGCKLEIRTSKQHFRIHSPRPE